MDVMYIGIATFIIIAIIMGVVLSTGTKKTPTPVPKQTTESTDSQISNIKSEAVDAIYADSIENFDYLTDATVQIPQSLYNQMVSQKMIRIANVMNAIRLQLVGPDVSYLCYQEPTNVVELYINGVRIFTKGLSVHRNELSSPTYMPLFGSLGLIIFYLNKKINNFIVPEGDPLKASARSNARMIDSVNTDANGNIESVILKPSVYRLIYDSIKTMNMTATGTYPPYIYSFFMTVNPLLTSYYGTAPDFTKPVDLNMLGILFICYFIYDADIRAQNTYVSFETSLFASLTNACPVVSRM